MNIIITGASQGIGHDTALLLSENPSNQVLAIARNAAALQNLAQQAVHSNIATCVADITQPTQLDAIVGYFPHIDILLNNAGSLINKPFANTSDEDWEQLLQTNVLAPARLVRLLLPFIGKQATKAHIVNIGSMGGFQGSSKFSGLAAYSTTKAALACLTECLAEEFKHLHLSVNCLALGAVQTDMLSNAFPGYQAPVTSKQMADFIAYFCQHGQHLYNGKVIPVSASTP